MNDIQEAFLNMLLKVQDNLEDNALAYADHLQIAPTKVILDAQIQSIIEAAGRATENITGVAMDKQEDRTALETIMYKVAKGVKAYAHDIGDNKLEQKATHEPSTLEKLQDTRLHYFALHLQTLLTPVIVAALGGYRVTAVDIADLPLKTAAYFTAIPETKDAIEARAEAGKQVDRHIAASRLTLEKLDNYVDSYRTDNIDLWEEYQMARSIDNPTGGGGGGGGGSEVVFSGSVPPMGSNVEGPVVYNAATPVALQNNSSVTLGFQLQMSGVSSGMIVNVAPMSTQNTTLGAMGTNGNEIRIGNSDMAQSAAYTITLG